MWELHWRAADPQHNCGCPGFTSPGLCHTTAPCPRSVHWLSPKLPQTGHVQFLLVGCLLTVHPSSQSSPVGREFSWKLSGRTRQNKKTHSGQCTSNIFSALLNLICSVSSWFLVLELCHCRSSSTLIHFSCLQFWCLLEGGKLGGEPFLRKKKPLANFAKCMYWDSPVYPPHILLRTRNKQCPL